MADKSTKLSIVIRTVDEATAKIKSINEQLDKATKPARDFKKALSDFKDKSGLGAVADGFKGVGGAITDLLGKVAMVGGVFGGMAGAAVAGVLSLVDKFDELGKKAQRIGIGADELAGLEYAAKQAGAPVDALDSSMETFSVSLGRAQAGTGRMLKFLNLVNPALAQQLIHTKNATEAELDLADAFAKETDPARRAALAAATGMDPAMIPFLMKGSKAIRAQTAEYAKLAPGQQKAAEAAAQAKEAMNKLHAAMDGAEAGIVTGLSPAITKIVDQITDWVTSHQTDIATWAAELGEKVPAAFNAVVDAVKGAIDWITPFVDEGWKLKAMAIAVGAVLVGPLLSAFATLGLAVVASPIGLQIAAWTAAAVAAVAAIMGAVKVGHWLGEKLAFKKLKDQHVREIVDQGTDLTQDEINAQAEKQAAYDIAAQHAVEDADDKRAQAAIDAARNPNVSPQAAAAVAPDVSAQASAAFDAAHSSNQVDLAPAQPAQAKITIDIANAPRGTRVTTAPGDTADVDLNVGYNMMPGMP